MKIFNLKTNENEVIDYNNIVVESVETVTIPERVETKRIPYTIGAVNKQLNEINIKIEALMTERADILELKSLLEAEADKVINAIR